jgi:hypothetical protein
VSDYKVWRKMFGQKREKVRWDWRKLRNDESFIIFTPHSIVSNKINKNDLGRVCARTRRRSSAYRFLAGKPKRKDTTWKKQT